jgi:hypothetical protein
LAASGTVSFCHVTPPSLVRRTVPPLPLAQRDSIVDGAHAAETRGYTARLLGPRRGGQHGRKHRRQYADHGFSPIFAVLTAVSRARIRRIVGRLNTNNSVGGTYARLKPCATFRVHTHG